MYVSVESHGTAIRRTVAFQLRFHQFVFVATREYASAAAIDASPRDFHYPAAVSVAEKARPFSIRITRRHRRLASAYGFLVA